MEVLHIQDLRTGAENRSAVGQRLGTVLWITGLSGAGKSTLARQCHHLIRETCANLVLLDGDAVRQVMGNDLGHGRDDRLRNAWRICRLCRMLSDQGLHVVVATMSLFHECHRWNRETMPNYFEVYLKVSLEVTRRRDPKGLYRRFDGGDNTGMVGLDVPIEEPLEPNLILENDQDHENTWPLARRILVAAEAQGHPFLPGAGPSE